MLADLQPQMPMYYVYVVLDYTVISQADHIILSATYADDTIRAILTAEGSTIHTSQSVLYMMPDSAINGAISIAKRIAAENANRKNPIPVTGVVVMKDREWPEVVTRLNAHARDIFLMYNRVLPIVTRKFMAENAEICRKEIAAYKALKFQAISTHAVDGFAICKRVRQECLSEECFRLMRGDYAYSISEDEGSGELPSFRLHNAKSLRIWEKPTEAVEYYVNKYQTEHIQVVLFTCRDALFKGDVPVGRISTVIDELTRYADSLASEKYIILTVELHSLVKRKLTIPHEVNRVVTPYGYDVKIIIDEQDEVVTSYDDRIDDIHDGVKQILDVLSHVASCQK